MPLANSVSPYFFRYVYSALRHFARDDRTALATPALTVLVHASADIHGH